VNGPIKSRGTSTTPADAARKMFANAAVPNDLDSSLARMKSHKPYSISIDSDLPSRIKPNHSPSRIKPNQMGEE